MSKNIKIFNGDCEIELSKLDNNSIDLLLTDPPYFIDKLTNKWDSKKVSNDSNSHIKHLPKGMKFDKSQVKNLYDYYLKISQIIFDKLKPGGYFLSFSAPRLYHSIAMACEIITAVCGGLREKLYNMDVFLRRSNVGQIYLCRPIEKICPC